MSCINVLCFIWLDLSIGLVSHVLVSACHLILFYCFSGQVQHVSVSLVMPGICSSPRQFACVVPVSFPHNKFGILKSIDLLLYCLYLVHHAMPVVTFFLDHRSAALEPVDVLAQQVMCVSSTSSETSIVLVCVWWFVR